MPAAALAAGCPSRAGSRSARRPCRWVRIIRHATSLGAVESTIDVESPFPVRPTYRPGLLRLSVGCEHPADLWRNLQQALTP
jgi:cystathionine gamma-synthase